MAIKFWDRVCGIDENFFTKFIFLFNAGFSLITVFSRWMSSSLDGNSFAVLKGSYTDALSNTFFLPSLYANIINMIIVIACGILVLQQKIKSQNAVTPVINIPKFNNVAYNDPLLNTKNTFILMFLQSTILLISIFNTSKEVQPTLKFDGKLEVINQLIFFIIFPIFVMSRRITFSKFIFREIQNFCW